MSARRPLLAGLLAGAILLLAPLATGTAGASTVVYQCGGAICAVNPDEASPQPRQLTADGRLAGITRDGAAVAWVEPSGATVKAPLSGGGPQTVYTGEVVSEPQISPDGTQMLWWYPGVSVWPGFFAVYISQLVFGGQVQGLSYCDCATSHGYLGANTPIAAFPKGATGSGSPSEICRLAPEGSGSCVQALAGDPRGNLDFPAGSPDGSQIVAALALPPAEDAAAGRIALYSTATGGLVRDVTTGTEDTTPQFSPDGRSVVFERAGQIVTHDLASGAEKTVGTGTYPFWGAADLPGSTPRLSLLVPHQTLHEVLRRRAIVVRCRLAAPGRCAVRATVTARTARRLGLEVPKKAKVRTLAKAARGLKKKGTAKLRLGLSRKDAAALRHRRSLKVKVTATATAPGTTPRRQVRRLTLRR